MPEKRKRDQVPAENADHQGAAALVATPTVAETTAKPATIPAVLLQPTSSEGAASAQSDIPLEDVANNHSATMAPVPPPQQPPPSHLQPAAIQRPSQPPHHVRQEQTAAGGNRARFMAGLQPTKVCCDLTAAPVNPGMRFSFEAIVLVVYPAKMTPPERRYVELMDEHGTTGITVWNAYVHALKPTTVGCVVKFARLSISMHNGKKSLTMAKDSTMHLEPAEYTGQLPKWWSGLLTQPPCTCAQFHDVATSSVVNVAGILGLIQQEEKIVNGEVKMLLILYITDKTGKIEIRSWNHSDTEFVQYRERPLLFNRVRVCQYAGTKTGELLTGPNGTKYTDQFDRAELEAYWRE